MEGHGGHCGQQRKTQPDIILMKFMHAPSFWPQRLKNDTLSSRIGHACNNVIRTNRLIKSYPVDQYKYTSYVDSLPNTIPK